MESKKCTKCGKVKSVDDFCRDRTKKDGRRPNCKVCKKKEALDYNTRNRERIHKRMREYYLENKEKVKASVKKRANEYLKTKVKVDPVFKIKRSIATSIRGVLTGTQGYTDASKIYQVIGLKEQDFINYLHSTFEANYGLPRSCIDLKIVQIDHIVPVSTTKTIEDVEKLNHYTNLQLLFKEDNVSKGTKISLDRLGFR